MDTLITEQVLDHQRTLRAEAEQDHRASRLARRGRRRRQRAR